MTGRDYRGFLSQHRAGPREIGRAYESDKLLIRMTEGLGSSRYTAPDYEKLKALALEKKISGNRSLIKVNRLAAISRASQEKSLLKQHGMVWQREVGRLDAARKRAESEQDSFFLSSTSEQSEISMFMLEAEDYQMELEVDRKAFKGATVDPLWTLREDLQAWLTENSPQFHPGSPRHEELAEQHTRITETIDSVKEQQQGILNKLWHEERALEQDLHSNYLRGLFAGAEKWVVEGIPTEAQVLICPDMELRSSVLLEFGLLDQKYLVRLRDLDKMHSDVLRSDTGGWDAADHFAYQVIVDQYPHDLSNRRALYIDRLRRQLPHKTRNDIVAHEDWSLHHRFYVERRRTLINCWARDKQELYDKAVTVFADACLAEELRQATAINRQRQDEICQQLGQKVQRWKEQKAEAMRLEDEIASQQRRQLEEQRAREEEADQKRRAVDKQKVEAYHLKQRKEQEAREKENKKRLADIQEAMELQAQKDRERVAYREMLLEERKQRQQDERRKEAENEMERERRLDALRQMVEVHVENDPQRVFQNTKAFKAHLGIGVDEDINIQKPLFDAKGFTAEQVTSDPRFKLEQALRKAGLHGNPYARAMMGHTKPLKPPRRDQESTVFKDLAPT
ncbi:coiled-coil domain-containing protein 148-like [Acanthaster planci]|uniref:Coiled-coil domain-containing protein 148-like n=1 Tax=Acanthaster planci TaxID=133434 RepID=A0A8B7XJJ5_ACAPL|nr:coiled-coil domain-containing protein 148-like [Acanthaster planci]